jgi:MoaD family protein
MQIRVLAFAQLREMLGGAEHRLELPGGARVDDAWAALIRAHPPLMRERASTRVARNGRLCRFDEPLADGDELAVLPPVGGG